MFVIIWKSITFYRLQKRRRGSRRKTGIWYMYVTITLARGVCFPKALPEIWSWMWEVFLTKFGICIFLWRVRINCHSVIFFFKVLIDRYLTRSVLVHCLSTWTKCRPERITSTKALFSGALSVTFLETEALLSTELLKSCDLSRISIIIKEDKD